MAYNAGVAAAAAAEQQRRMFEEEEQLTPYSADELQNDWELKIVRANYGAFGKPDRLARLIEQEKQAGWVLLEKLDDSRVRFKRPRSAQANDAQVIASGFDPYRTQVGMARTAAVLMIMVGAVVLVILFAIIAFMMASSPVGY
jgi:hypothetical protein